MHADKTPSVIANHLKSGSPEILILVAVSHFYFWRYCRISLLFHAQLAILVVWFGGDAKA